MSRPLVRRSVHAVLLAMVSVALVGCHSVPGTGRNQLNAYSVHEEMQLGNQAFDEMISDARLKKKGVNVKMVERVADRIAAAALRLHPGITEHFDWEVVVIDDDEIANAWALPGGKMAVYTGILPFTRTEDGLAVVMGHEAAHAIARHGGENMTRAGLVNAAVIGAAIALDEDDAPYLAGAAAAYGLLGEPAFSRVQESEADELGLFLTADAGYDPRAAIGLWERMGAEGGGPPEFLSTHPSEQTRINQLNAIMPQAMAIYRRALQREGRDSNPAR
ncbi:MAG: M48 family metallopeptidase [Phycisphaerales bacterium]|nr:M48 family metallopeptidase [Phycisphaerales bacterium]